MTLQCVSNEVGGDLVGNAVWQGVPLAALLDRAGVQDDATQIVGRSVDRLTAGFPTDIARDGRVALGRLRDERRAAADADTASRPASSSPACTATCRRPSG